LNIWFFGKDEAEPLEGHELSILLSGEVVIPSYQTGYIKRGLTPPSFNATAVVGFECSSRAASLLTMFVLQLVGLIIRKPAFALSVAFVTLVLSVYVALAGYRPLDPIFYDWLRWIVFLASAYYIVDALSAGRRIGPALFLVLLVVFNPFAQFHFSAPIWHRLDAMGMVLFGVTAWKGTNWS
jgi:hypothetical protein